MDTSLQQLPALVIVSGPDEGRRFTLGPAQMVIGRGDDVDIALGGNLVSRHHAALLRQGNSVVFEDLGSSNGSWHNGLRVTQPVTLNPGDLLLLGNVELQFGVATIPAQRSGPTQVSYDFGNVSGPVNAGSGNLNTGSGSQYVAGRDIHHGDKYAVEVNNDYDPWDEVWQGQGIGRWLLALGGVIALCGFGLWVSLMFSAFTADDPFTNTPFDKQIAGVPALGVGFALIVGGGVLSGIGNGMSKAARKRRPR
jgi:hypothetical protein